ncbi:hypothetical protein P0082_07130 [Candidatus Haliotispira prima]|uniref:DUF3782 domain-containing protein n=1 Tax=Candidatus Haliotispira prima TaxID=3034016 RepID=A0ABY8ME39_9SPIO|nr:hypothetical protein P0082_07130 [Candidatus Haliotispira prima]
MDNTQFDKMMQGMFQGMAELRESQAKSQAKADLESQKLREFQAETSLQIRESQAKTDLQLRESQAKADFESQKLRELQAETSLQLRESQAKADFEFQKLRELQAETSLQIRESQAKTDLQLRELERKLTHVGEILGSIGINTGLFAERLFASSFQKNPVLGGIRYNIVRCNVRDGNGKTEYDILLINGSSVAIVEVKYKAHPKDIEDLLEKKVAAFRSSHREYAGHKLYLALATTVSNDELVQKAGEAGIYLLSQEGQHVELLSGEVRTF